MWRSWKRHTIGGRAPSALQGVQVGAADSAVRDLDVDVVLRPFLGLELAPFHVALKGALVEAEPALELRRVLASHCAGGVHMRLLICLDIAKVVYGSRRRASRRFTRLLKLFRIETSFQNWESQLSLWKLGSRAYIPYIPCLPTSPIYLPQSTTSGPCFLNS